MIWLMIQIQSLKRSKEFWKQRGKRVEVQSSGWWGAIGEATKRTRKREAVFNNACHSNEFEERMHVMSDVDNTTRWCNNVMKWRPKKGHFWGSKKGSKRGPKKGQKRAFLGTPRKLWSVSYGHKMAKNSVFGGGTARGLYFWCKPRKWPKIDVFGVFWRPPQKWPILSTTRKHASLMKNMIQQHVEQRSTSSLKQQKSLFWP